jgi:hypothetical protein
MAGCWDGLGCGGEIAADRALRVHQPAPPPRVAPAAALEGFVCACAQGNILENKKLLVSLNELKSNAQKITDKLSESSQLQEALDSERNAFRPIARKGSKLFFTLLDLLRINPMYKYSLPMFLELFDKARPAPSAGSFREASPLAPFATSLSRPSSPTAAASFPRSV